MKQQLYIYLSIIVFTIITACAPTRRVATTHVEVRDTTHVVIHDTIHVTQLHDSIVYHAAATMREAETTTYDPTTGHPMQHQRERNIDIDITAIIQHIADSLFAASTHSTSSYNEEVNDTHEEADPVRSILSPIQLFARKISTMVCVLFVIFAVIIAIRIYLSRKDTHC